MGSFLEISFFSSVSSLFLESTVKLLFLTIGSLLLVSFFDESVFGLSSVLGLSLDFWLSLVLVVFLTSFVFFVSSLPRLPVLCLVSSSFLEDVLTLLFLDVSELDFGVSITEDFLLVFEVLDSFSSLFEVLVTLLDFSGFGMLLFLVFSEDFSFLLLDLIWEIYWSLSTFSSIALAIAWSNKFVFVGSNPATTLLAFTVKLIWLKVSEKLELI